MRIRTTCSGNASGSSACWVSEKFSPPITNQAKARDAPKRGETLGLTEDEMCFYDALVDHGNVKSLMDDKQLAAIAHELVEGIRQSVTIDWTKKESVRANMRRRVKKLLRKHGYPPDKRAEAVITVLQQAELVCRDWTRAA